ncbi:MAG: sulfatase [Planctomycetota bacterium]|jgi:arylsulfatase A-like enzyme
MKEAQQVLGFQKTKVSRRQVLKAGLGAFMGFSFLHELGCVDASGMPNIVMIVPDALRARSMSMYGCPRNTSPFLQTLSKHASLFKRCYSSALWTRPAVTGLLTGLAPLEHRHWRFKKSITPDTPSFGQVLGEEGYHTGFFTANPAIGEAFGMEDHFDAISFKAGKDRDFGPRIIHDCEKWLRTLSSKPVCLYLHLFPPHGPYDPPIQFQDSIRRQGRPRQDYLAPGYRDVNISIGGMCMGRIPWYQAVVNQSKDPVDYLTRYEASIAYADNLIAEFMYRWNRLRSTQRTIFIITSDHGESLGEHGHFCGHGKMLADPIMHVPLIIQDTADPIERVIDEPVSHLDLPNAIMKWCGLENKLGTYGKAFSLGGWEPGQAPRTVLVQDGLDGGESGTSITKGDWRLVYNDCPRYGNSNIVRIDSCNDLASQIQRVPIPHTPSAMHHPKEIATHVVVDSFALDTHYVESGKNHGFLGRVVLNDDLAGTLSIRARTPGQPPVAIGEYECSGRNTAFEGSLPAFFRPHTAEEMKVICEARWTPRSGSGSHTTWHRLIGAPIHKPYTFSEDIELLGVEITPPVAIPGDTVQVTYIWRFLRDTELELRVEAGFLDARDRKRFDNDHWFLKDEDDPEASALPKSKYVKGLRFDESHWVTIPEDAETGVYGLRVGLEGFKKKDVEDRKYEVGTPVVASVLEVVSTAPDAFQRLVIREEAPTAFRVFSADEFKRQGRYDHVQEALEQYVERFPGEGHADFLLAGYTDDAELRNKLILDCLEATPRHRAALIQAEKLRLADHALDTLKGMKPEKSCNYWFRDLIRLFGFKLKKTPDEDAFYVSLFWECLAPMKVPYAAELVLTYEATKERTRQKDIWWFIGGGDRPTTEWKVGEVVVDTVYMPLPNKVRRPTLSVKIYPHWDHVYSGRDNKYYLRISNLEEEPLTEAALPTPPLKQIRVQEENLLHEKRGDKKFYQLYDLSADPEEAVNLADAQPEIFESMRDELWSMVDESFVIEEEPGEEEQEEELSDETLENLRALGYIK